MEGFRGFVDQAQRGRAGHAGRQRRPEAGVGHGGGAGVAAAAAARAEGSAGIENGQLSI